MSDFHVNYFTIRSARTIGDGMVLLVLSHDYGQGPAVYLPISGSDGDFEVGNRVEVNVSPVKNEAETKR